MKKTNPAYFVASNPTQDGTYLVDGTKYINKIHIIRLKTTRTPYDEWETEASVRFELRLPETIRIFSNQFEISGVVLQNVGWSDEMELVYVCRDVEGQGYLLNLPILTELKREIYNLFILEENKPRCGIFDNHSFSYIDLFVEFE